MDCILHTVNRGPYYNWGGNEECCGETVSERKKPKKSSKTLRFFFVKLNCQQHSKLQFVVLCTLWKPPAKTTDYTV